MQYWFLGVSFIVGCAILSTPKFMEVGADMGGPRVSPAPQSEKPQSKGPPQQSSEHQRGQSQPSKPSGYK